MTATLRNFMIYAFFLICGCSERRDENTIVFGTSADYPPFELFKDGEITGFEIDLASAVAREQGKVAKFKDMSFASMFSSLQNGNIDVAVASITPTNERRKLYDFTDSYYKSAIVFVCKRCDGKLNIEDLSGQKIACQLGSIQEQWVKKEWTHVKIVSINNVVQAVEFIKSGQVVGIVVDEIVAEYLCKSNPGLDSIIVAETSDHEGGTAMAVKKGSSNLDLLNSSLKKITDSGELQKIKEKWNIK
jgi:polar amino acid transport system substrate-binding protein